MTEITYPAGKSGMIAVYDNYLDPAICRDLLDSIITNYNELSHDGRTIGGVEPRSKFSRDAGFNNQYFIEHGQEWTNKLQDIDDKIATALTGLIASYRCEYQVLHDWMQIEDTGFQIQKYEQNLGYYRPHVDSLPGTKAAKRVLACIIYLNTVENGGSTRFPLHNVNVNPVQGRVALFPATWTHLHEGMPPLSGDKWIISTFLINEPQEEHPPHTKFEDAFSHPHEDDHTH